MAESGEKEVQQAFEQVIRRNVSTAVEHSNESRKIVRDLETKVQTLENIVMTFQGELELIKKQLSVVQTRLFSGGTSG